MHAATIVIVNSRACSRGKNSATNEGPGLPSRDRVEIQSGYGPRGHKKIKVFFLKK